ncbi:MAG TPA: SpoIIE family protein phosphatase [Nocardioidaceae bacterium]|nr:SpoIIE family protein phosphatase [Nocardioidaceae bacterium]
MLLGGRLLLVALAYYLGARLGLSLSLVGENVTPLWPPTGIALAAFLLMGRSMWPAVAVAAFAVNLPISEGPIPAAVTAVGNTAAPLLAAVLLSRVGFRRQLDRSRDAVALVFLAALASMLVSATIGALTLVASDAIPSDEFPSAWAVWWTGDAMGVLAVAPFLLCLPLFWEGRRWPDLLWLEAALMLVGVAAVTTVVSLVQVQLLILVLPMLGWASWRFQLRGAAPAALIASLIATWAATRELGPFESGSLLERMLTLQGFNACVALTSFFLAAMVTERQRTLEALEESTHDLEDRVRLRTLELSAANARLVSEIKERFETQEQLSQEEERSRREHQKAETLQRSLLPDRLPEVPGVALASRYVPATSDIQVGGDWYDVVPLPGGKIGLAIGDVAGHGLQAAATMGQVRMALRAYALQDPSPVAVVTGLHRLVEQLPMSQMVTLLYLVFDPATGSLRFTNAGHPPALVLGDGGCDFLLDAVSPPIGVAAASTFFEAGYELPPGATLLLYTDGLVERRGVSIQEGLDRLSSEALCQFDGDVEALCDHLISVMLDQDTVSDDTALLAMRLLTTSGGPLRLTVPAEPRQLAQVRSALRLWLREHGVAREDENEILVACGEACANVVQHAYGVAAGGLMDIEGVWSEGTIELSIRDRGQWRPPGEREGGWGLQLVQAVMDSVDVETKADGTVIRMRRRVQVGAER